MYDCSVERVLHAQAARAEHVMLGVVAGGVLEGENRPVSLALVVGVDDQREGVVALLRPVDRVDDLLRPREELRREHLTEDGLQLRDQTR